MVYGQNGESQNVDSKTKKRFATLTFDRYFKKGLFATLGAILPLWELKKGREGTFTL
jgi:hypothetical protein